MKNQFELSIDHPLLKTAKAALDACLKAMVSKAVSTGSMEGKTNLQISMEIMEAPDELTGEMVKIPDIKFKASFEVPMKYKVDGKVRENSSLQRDNEGAWMLVNGQVSMDELMEEEGNGG